MHTPPKGWTSAVCAELWHGRAIDTFVRLGLISKAWVGNLFQTSPRGGSWSQTVFSRPLSCLVYSTASHVSCQHQSTVKPVSFCSHSSYFCLCSFKCFKPFASLKGANTLSVGCWVLHPIARGEVVWSSRQHPQLGFRRPDCH